MPSQTQQPPASHPSAQLDLADLQRCHALQEEHEAEGSSVDFVRQCLGILIQANPFQGSRQPFVIDVSQGHLRAQ